MLSISITKGKKASIIKKADFAEKASIWSLET